jgi:hypothetical protein
MPVPISVNSRQSRRRLHGSLRGSLHVHGFGKKPRGIGSQFFGSAPVAHLASDFESQRSLVAEVAGILHGQRSPIRRLVDGPG